MGEPAVIPATPADLVVLRDYQDGDHNCVYDAWLRGFRYSDEVRKMSWGNYSRWMRSVLSRLLERADTRIKVAVSNEHADLIHGWICWTRVGSTPVLHWLYVKRHYKPFGIAHILCQSAGITPHESIMYTFRQRKGSDNNPTEITSQAVYVAIEEFLE